MILSAFGEYVVLMNLVAGGILLVTGVSFMLLERRTKTMFWKKREKEEKTLFERLEKARTELERRLSTDSTAESGRDFAVKDSFSGGSEHEPLTEMSTSNSYEPVNSSVTKSEERTAFDRLFQEIFAKHIQTEVDLTFELPATESQILGKKFNVYGKVRVVTKREKPVVYVPMGVNREERPMRQSFIDKIPVVERKDGHVEEVEEVEETAEESGEAETVESMETAETAESTSATESTEVRETAEACEGDEPSSSEEAGQSRSSAGKSKRAVEDLDSQLQALLDQRDAVPMRVKRLEE